MNINIVNKLEELKHAGAAWQKEAKGDFLMMELKALLPDNEYWSVSIARSHWMTGEGRGELDHICNSLIAKYRADTPPRNFTKTLL